MAKRLDDDKIAAALALYEKSGFPNGVELWAGINSLQALRDLKDARAALRKWKCPTCMKWSVPNCRICEGTGIHPIALEALGE